VLQLSEPLRLDNDEAIRIFGTGAVGTTLFALSMLNNPVLDQHYNSCELGGSEEREHAARRQFFRGDWM
jgi:hypothetical protein